DISPHMLERASSSLCDADLDVTFRHGDMRALPYGDNVFDLAMTAHVLEHLLDPSAALNEMVRVLKPGGLLLACFTRRSVLGMMVHLKWRTHRLTPAQAQSWLWKAGWKMSNACPSMIAHCAIDSVWPLLAESRA